MRANALAIAAFVAALLGATYLYVFDPSQSGHYPPCPFHWLTGLHCPGCGSLRSLHHLLHWEWARAIQKNGLTALTTVLLFLAALPRSPFRTAFTHPAAPKVWGVLLITYGVARNTPFFAFLAPQ